MTPHFFRHTNDELWVEAPGNGTYGKASEPVCRLHAIS